MELSTIAQDVNALHKLTRAEIRAEMVWIQATIDWCLERVEMTDVTIRVEFNARFTRRMGDALVTFAGYASRTGRVRFSASALWRRASAVKRRNTVVHEVAHILAEILAGVGARVGHGPGWKRMMRRLGEEPVRCHTVNRDGLRRGRRRAPVRIRAPRPTAAPRPVVTRPVAPPAVVAIGVSVTFRHDGVTACGIALSASNGRVRLRIVGDHARVIFGDFLEISAEKIRG